MTLRSRAFPVLVAASLALVGCAKQADGANATLGNDVTLNDADDANLFATDSLDGNAADSNVTAAPGNAL